MKTNLYAALLISTGLNIANAGEADVVDAQAICNQGVDFICNFQVTVQHADNGWDHYADKWDILDENGNLLATRILHHPHEDEQPFTRSLSNVKINAGIESVVIRAHDSVHAYGGKTFKLRLPGR